MTISVNDIKLLKSQRLTDEDDGGGRATGQAVVDSEVNNLFPDISRLDRTTGRINLRKVFAGVVSTNSDAYLGGHAILTKAPADPRVSVLLFNTGSQTDERKDARNAIESFVVPAVAAPFELLGNQLQGQRAIAGIQREEQRLPEIGEVYQLVNGSLSQYVRITGVEARLESFTYDYGNGNFVNFTRRRLDLSISSPLLNAFAGGTPTPAGTVMTGTSAATKSQVLTTQVADAAHYYGISPLAEAVTQGVLSLKVKSVYSQLVPSTTRENALIDQLAGYQRRLVLATGPARSVNLTVAMVSGGQSRTFLGTACAPGTLSLTVNSGVFADDSAGKLRFISGSNWITAGTIDYETGEINLTRTGAGFTGSATASYQPGAAATGEAVTGEIPIDLSNRGYVYTLSLSDAPPMPGTLEVSYMALGKWQTIRDPGNGELTGEGTGSIAFATGSVSLTLNALPDVGSSVIWAYVGQNSAAFTQRTGVSVQAKAKVSRTLPHQGLLPGSYSATFKVGGVTKTITDAGNGTLSGSGGSGVINYAAGTVSMELVATPDAGTGITHAYQQGSFTDTPLAVTSDSSGVCSGTIPGAPLKPGSVQIGWVTKQRQAVPAIDKGVTSSGNTLPVYESEVLVNNTITDNGSGGWIGRTGSINYQTGAFSLQAAQLYTLKEYTYATKKNGFKPDTLQLVTTNTSLMESFGGTLSIRAQANGQSYGAQTDVQTVAPVTLDLLPGIAESILPGSLVFTWGGETYVDRSGVLYKNISSSTNAGTAVGSVDYAARTATLSTYSAGAGSAVTLLACLTTNAGFAVNAMTFRTPGAPLRAGSLQVTAVRVDTAQVVTATADANGVFNGAVIKGTVDIATGIVRLRFTSNLNDQTGASDIRVIPILLRYNGVVYSTLPLDASLIGLDPVRLPSDGRVPIYRQGDVLVIAHTAQTTVASPAAGGTLQLARQQQAAIEVVDANGVALRAASYSVNRELGRVTWANPMVLQDASGNPLTLPLVVRDRVEHMTLCTEVQISGQLGLASPLPWDLPANDTMVSSAVSWGDLQSRYHHWFTQKTWSTGSPNWTDVPVGDTTTANYNTLSYPPIVTNQGTIDGKWALVFTSATQFQVVEEKLGVISTGTTSSDCAPINPETNTPYFTIRAAGWGGGWAAANAVRFNTDSALGPLWIARTVLSGQGTVDDDQFKLQIRGDAD
ncbi:hypothetical protein [Pseudomonas panipatensis]|uniref:Uncharacterized protein n=1 Tax=Pseudomonas panipatensis TaxID=428992 RepID=A0A1G8CWP5_9PSED|nr:hypothetical protein [Pseudomonas panipatensis]SDH49623.1 hypothetical protein SAMN05216272_101797 [Pseudomonas panipatensis]SMP63319.1 hypothetical protein SAMN06295951_10645 [Pseudomonas panipatensis]